MSQGAGASGVPHLETTARYREAGPKSRLPAQGMARAQRGPRPSIAMPSDCLVYVLDVSATLAQNQVVIDLARRQRKTTGEWGPLRPWYYAPHAAHVKYDPEDRLILALLDEAQGAIAHGVYSTTSFRVARINISVRRDQWRGYSNRLATRRCLTARRHRREPPLNARYAVCAALCFAKIRQPWWSG